MGNEITNITRHPCIISMARQLSANDELLEQLASELSTEYGLTHYREAILSSLISVAFDYTEIAEACLADPAIANRLQANISVDETAKAIADETEYGSRLGEEFFLSLIHI